MAASYRLGAGAVLGLLIAVGALVRLPIVTACLCVALTIAMTWSWMNRIKLPARKSSALVVTVVGALSAFVFLYSEVDEIAHYLTLVGALGLVLAFLTQMLRRTRERITESISSTVACMCLSLLIPGWILIMRHEELALAGASASAIAMLSMALPVPTAPRLALTTALSAAAAACAPVFFLDAPVDYSLAALGAGIGIAVFATGEILSPLASPGPLPLPSGATSATVIETLKSRQPRRLSFPESLALCTGQLGVASVLVFIAAYALT